MRRSPARGDSSQHCPSLYRRLLGERYQCMPSPLRMLHDINNGRAVGRAEIDGAATAMGRLLAHLFGFPPTGSQVPVTVDFARGNGTEIWLREFAGRRLRSIQYLGSGRWQGKLVERFGGVSYAMEAPVSSQGLDLRIVAGRCFGIPMPRFALPFVAASERVDEQGRFCFAVEVGLPLIGRLVRYRGWLVPDLSDENLNRPQSLGSRFPDTGCPS